MANPHQRRKARSGRASGSSAASKRQQRNKLVRAPPVKGPAVLQESWDGKKTVRQNYAALGLVADVKLRPSGGTAPGTASSSGSLEKAKAKGKGKGKSTNTLPKGVGRIIRDADGNVVDIIEGGGGGGEEGDEETPWGKSMKGWEDDEAEAEEAEMGQYDDDDDDGADDAEEETEVVKALRAIPDPGPPLRHVSSLEASWLLSLVSKHGDDYDGMFMDRRLNQSQKTKGEIRSRINRAGGIQAVRQALLAQE